MALLSIFGLAVVAVPLYFVVITIYRLTLHPLAKYPGPLSWRISGWPDAIVARKGIRHVALQDLHRRYGHIVRIGPNRLSFDSAQAFHDIITDRNANVIKSGFVEYTRQVTEAWHLQQTVDKRDHAQRRRIMGHAFTDSALKSAESFMLVQIQNWTTALQKGADKSTDRWSETKDLSLWTNLLTLDVFGELCFGKSFGAVNAGDHDYVHLSVEGGKMAQQLAYLPIGFLLIPILRTKTLLKLLSSETYKNRWALRTNMLNLITERQQLESDKSTAIRKDFFHHVLKARDDEGNALSLKTFTSEALLLIVAGTDTTSTALSSTLFYLNRHPTKLAKLRAEIDQAFPGGVDDIHTGPVLSSCTYLRACAEEGIRMSPPVPGPLTRRTLKGGATVDDIPLPEGIDIEVPIYVLAHSDRYFPDSSSYIPERWIPGSKTPTFEVTEDLVTKQRTAFVPFSTGAASCLGTRMAYMELGLVLARLVYLFDMRFDEKLQPQTKDFEILDWFISDKEGPYLQFKLREGRQG